MEKIKILGIWHNSKSKAGKEYISSKGKPYELCSIKDDKGYISGFGNSITKSWKVGDEIEVEVTVNGQFRNFKLPDQKVSRAEFDLLAKKVKFLEDEVSYLHGYIESKSKESEEKAEEIDLGDEPLGGEPPEEGDFNDAI